MKALSVHELRVRGTYRPDRHAARDGDGAPRPRSAKIPPAPRGLSKIARRTWRRIMVGWKVDPAGLVILQTGVEAADRIAEARKIIAREGLVSRTVRGAVRAHPALRVASANALPSSTKAA